MGLAPHHYANQSNRVSRSKRGSQLNELPDDQFTALYNLRSVHAEVFQKDDLVLDRALVRALRDEPQDRPRIELITRSCAIVQLGPDEIRQGYPNNLLNAL